jgi:hypothetical protein
MPYVEFDGPLDDDKKAASSFVPFDGKLDASAKPVRERTWGEALTDTASQLGEGVNNIAGAIPNLIAPESGAAKFFNDGAKSWRDAQSDPIKQRTAAADAKISAAGEEGVIAQVVEAAKQYSSAPALAARFVTTNLPSMIPGIGAAKIAQAAALARGATAVKAAAVATTAAGATNAALNAGGARGEAFEDIKATLVKQGMSPLEAEQKAIADSRLPAAVGGVTGFISGKTGLEGAIAGTASRGAGGMLRRGAASAVTEMAGEQLEEVAPKLATNYQAGQYDGRAITKDVGRTMVETAIGSGPGAAVGAWAAARNPQSAADPAPPPPAIPIPAPAARIEPSLSDIGNAETVDDAIRAAADLISTPAAPRADLPTSADIDALEDAYVNGTDAPGLPDLPGMGRDDGPAADLAAGPGEASADDRIAGAGRQADPALPGPDDGIAVPAADNAADGRPALSDSGIPTSAAPDMGIPASAATSSSTTTQEGNADVSESPQVPKEGRAAQGAQAAQQAAPGAAVEASGAAPAAQGNAAAPVKRKLYHGTRAEFDSFDADRSGGMVSFAENRSDARRYAMGAGGARQSITSENSLIFNDDGYAYRIEGDSAVPVGTWEDGDDLSAQSVAPLKGGAKPASLTVDQARKRVDDGFASVVPVSSRIIEADVDGANLIDTTTDEGVAFIAGLTPTNRVMQGLVEAAKMDIKTGGRAQFNYNFWASTKAAGSLGQQLKEGIVKALKDAGYDGIRFSDDGHTTVGLFDTGLAKTAGAGKAAKPARDPNSKLEQRRALNDKQDEVVRQAAIANEKRKLTGGQAARERVGRENPLLAFLGEHGVNLDERSDTGGEKRKNAMLPGFGPIYRRSGKRLDELAALAVEAGFLTSQDVEDETDNGGTRKLADMIQRAVHNKEVIGRAASEPAVADVDQRLIEDAERMGIDTAGKTADQLYDEVVALDAAQFSDAEANLAGAIFDDIPLDGGADSSNLTDEDLDAIFGIQSSPTQGAARQTESDTAEPARGSDPGAEETRSRGEGEDLLSSYSAADVVAREEATTARDKGEATERARADAARKKDAERRDIDARMDASAENFQLGQSADDPLSGQEGLAFSVAGDTAIPPAFYSRVDVQVDVWDKAASSFKSTTMPADQALDSVREDITTYRRMIACMKS